MTARRRLPPSVLARVLAGILAGGLAGCAAAVPSPSASPAGSVGPVATATPALTPVLPGPSGAAPLDPSAVPTEPEAALLHGARLDLQGSCAPLGEDVPAGAIGAVACAPPSDVASRVTIAMYGTTEGLLAAYEARVAAEGIEMRTHEGRCLEAGASEGAYLPGDDRMELAERGACWTDASGTAHYLATLPPFVMVEVEGRPGGGVSGVETYAWLGNQDAPGSPTVWATEPRDPEK